MRQHPLRGLGYERGGSRCHTGQPGMVQSLVHQTQHLSGP